MDVSNPAAFDASLDALVEFRGGAGGRTYKGRFAQLFLGLKCFQSEIPSMFSGGFVSSGILESMLDDLYQKQSKPLDGCVLSLFEGNFLPRTGVKASGKSYPANNWRNNFSLQKGIGCFAPTAELSSYSFLEEARENCKHLVPGADGTIKGGHCSLNPGGPSYRSEQHRKWLRIDPGGGGYAVADLLNVGNFLPYLAPGGQRIPILPLVVALYHDAQDGTVTGDRDATNLGIEDFCTDFNFSPKEVEAYFDVNPKHPLNAALVTSFPDLEYEMATKTPGGVGGPLGGLKKSGAKGGSSTIPEPKLGGTAAPPPQSHNGWDAEQFVASTLKGAGWEVHDVSRQRLGYDILAKRGRKTIFVEVKSSLGLCSPTFTAREWHQAQTYNDRFILAIVENFDPTGIEINRVHWVKDPFGSCAVNCVTSKSYTISRGQWVSAVIEFEKI